MIIWRVWDSDDMALSDSYFPTKREALQALHNYGIRIEAMRPDDILTDCLTAVSDTGDHVFLERLDIEPTRAGIAHALKHIPHR